MSHRITTLEDARALQAIETRDSGGPGPGSRKIAGKRVNICPRCCERGTLTPVTPLPYTCPSCGWTAESDPRGCWLAVREVYTQDGVYAYDVSADMSQSTRLTAEERTAWAQARAAAVDELPPGPPEWAPAKGLDK